MRLFPSLTKDLQKAKLKIVLAERKDEYVYGQLYSEILSFATNGDKSASRYMNVSVSDCEVQEVISFMKRSLFSNNRLLVIHCQSLKAMGRKIGDKKEFKKIPQFDETLLEAMSNQRSDVIVLITASDIDKRNQFYKRVESDGVFVECKPLDVKRVKELIASELKSNGQSMSADTQEFFLSYVDLDCSVITGEISKLNLAGVKKITRSEIETYVVKSHSYAAFELGDAISKKDTGLSISIMNSLMESTGNAMQVIGLIGRQFHLMYLLKVCSGDISKQAGISPYFLKRYREQSKSFGLKKLERFISRLLDCELELRTSNVNETLLLETLIIELCL